MRRNLSELDDMRLIHRGNQLLHNLFCQGCASIRRLSGSEAEAKGAYRFLRNERVSEEELVANMAANCRHAAHRRWVICLQDTTEINVATHRGRLPVQDADLGVTGAGQGLGFFVHPTLVVDARDATPLGFADVLLWNRPRTFTPRPEGAHKELPLEEKESYKWMQGITNTQEQLGAEVAHMVFIQDREGDIYEHYVRAPNSQSDLLVRASRDRCLQEGGHLYPYLGQQPVAQTHEVYVPASGKRKARRAQVEVRFCRVQVRRPGNNVSPHPLPPAVALWAVEVREVGYRGKDALLWRLLTTLALADGAEAALVAEWYSWRWMIEEVFRIVKKEGFDVESSELGCGTALRKLTLLVMETAIKLLLMRFCYAEPEGEGLPAGACFTEMEQQCVEELMVQWEGKTARQKNPFAPGSLRRCVWLLARMGGWKGYEHNRHPGITCLWHGVQFFAAAMQGWIIKRNVSTR